MIVSASELHNLFAEQSSYRRKHVLDPSLRWDDGR